LGERVTACHDCGEFIGTVRDGSAQLLDRGQERGGRFEFSLPRGVIREDG